jgi:hypothetical protein
VNRHELLSGLHQTFAPRTYLEIGVNRGHSLGLSRTRTIGIDPDFRIRVDIECDLKLVKATSDDFFARPNPIDWFPAGVIDLAFIDGMHLFEFALRDFINVERLSSPTSVVVIDDMLPRTVDEAARDRHTLAWTGDVFKVATVLERYRPDLVVLPVDTTPTGVVVVIGLDPSNSTLLDHYDEILAEYATNDPQDVPTEILNRSDAADPTLVLASELWTDLRQARAASGEGLSGLAALRELRATATYSSDPPEAEAWPPKPAKSPKPAAAAKPQARSTSGPGETTSAVTRVRKAIKRRL